MPPPNLTPLADIPLYHDGDGYLIEVAGGERVIKITRILVFPGNENSSPKVERFGDLDSRARSAIIQQINRRHVGKMVHI